MFYSTITLVYLYDLFCFHAKCHYRNVYAGKSLWSVSSDTFSGLFYFSSIEQADQQFIFL